MRGYIAVGDTVDVKFENIEPIFSATVLYMPASDGDCWVIEKGGRTYYVKNFSIMSKKQD